MEQKVRFWKNFPNNPCFHDFAILGRECFGEVARVEFNTVTVTSITPQVATVFEYNPWELFIRLDFRSGILFSPIIISYDIFVTLYVEYLIKPQLSQIKTCIEKMMARFL